MVKGEARMYFSFFRLFLFRGVDVRKLECRHLFCKLHMFSLTLKRIVICYFHFLNDESSNHKWVATSEYFQLGISQNRIWRLFFFNSRIIQFSRAFVHKNCVKNALLLCHIVMVERGGGWRKYLLVTIILQFFSCSGWRKNWKVCLHYHPTSQMSQKHKKELEPTSGQFYEVRSALSANIFLR